MRLSRALFLSGSLGKGHDVLAEACAAALHPLGVESRVVDSMEMLGRGAAMGDWVFRKLLSVGPVYDFFHFSQLRDDGRLGRAADRVAIAKMLPALRAEVEDFRPELLVPVFATGAGAAARLKELGFSLQSVVIMTDSFAHRMWVHESTDLFLVTSPAAAESVRRYWPEARVGSITAPVRPEFYAAPSLRGGPAAAGDPPGCVVRPADVGGMGLGPLG